VVGGAVDVLGHVVGGEGGLNGTVGRGEVLSLASISAASSLESTWLGGACCDGSVDYCQQASCVTMW